MKKIFVLILVFVWIVIPFAGCAKESTYTPTEVENVSIHISDVSPTGATVTIKDTNKEPYIYGLWFSIEKETDGKWQEVKPIIDNFGFDEIGYLPDSNGEVKLITDWEWLYGQLPSGNYRFLKQAGSECISVVFSIG